MLWNTVQLALKEMRRNLMRSVPDHPRHRHRRRRGGHHGDAGKRGHQGGRRSDREPGQQPVLMPGQRPGPNRDRTTAASFKVADVRVIEEQVGGIKALAPTSGASATPCGWRGTGPPR